MNNEIEKTYLGILTSGWTWLSLIGVPTIIIPVLRIMKNTYSYDDTSIYIKTGIINTNTKVINFRDIKDIESKSTFGSSTITIDSGIKVDKMPYVKNGDDVLREIKSEWHKNQPDVNFHKMI